MSVTEQRALLGAGIDRVDGPVKVTGAAPYPSDVRYPDMAHAALVGSTVAAGRVSQIDSAAARAQPGVLMVITHENAPTLRPGAAPPFAGPTPPALQDDRVHHYGQYVAVVVANTPQQAASAARLVSVSYEPDEPLLAIDDARGELLRDPWGFDSQRGDVAAGMAAAEVRLEARFTTSENTNNPLGLFSTVAAWDGDTVIVHDVTQFTSNVQASIAKAFELPESAVRVIVPYVGGGFGAGLRVWPHTLLTVLAARLLRRPVKTVLTRPQMFTGVGHRANTVQTVKLGAMRDGELTAIDHESLQTVAVNDDNVEPVASGSASSYACANASTRDLQRRLNIPVPGSMRAPGEAQGNFALECALDELSYELGIDPLQLRLRNYAEVQPASGLPWSSKAQRECFAVGAERFGWFGRNPEVGSMQERGWRVGYGLAGAAYGWWQARTEARVTVYGDGSAFVRSAATDIGTGTYTVMKQLSAELLGLELRQVRFDLGDSDMPYSTQSGGSGLTGALGNAINVACNGLIEKLLALVADDDDSPLQGCSLEDVVARDGGIYRREHGGGAGSDAGEGYGEILARHGVADLTVDGESVPPDPGQTGMALTGAFGAKFVEVRVDPDLGLLRVARVTSVIDGGRILNEKLARSQILGATVGGIGQAIFEETVTDPGTGRIANATFGDYLVAVNADVPELDVVFVGEPDRNTPIGTKGIGEVGLVGTAAAIANAVYHATGKRLRSLPITLDQLM
ncbi:MAG TPA: xanthine dehydrogenase family protein molybdopterin-binding subunit [Conexibacter sp.]|jgi:xanthine dehydrogenase YagR molybdenum-binding subunit